MNAEQLKQLAARLREALASSDVAIAHGQALDMVAALPGLRNWPEVLAFPDRLATRDYDLDAMARLGRRITTRLGSRLTERAARQLTPDNLMDRLMPWQLIQPEDPSRRERLIIVSGDSSSGSLRASKIADRVERTLRRLVWGPVPLEATDPENFGAQRLAAWNSDPHTEDQPEPWERADVAQGADRPSEWTIGLPIVTEYSRIELWMDPDVNGQLQLLQLLDWFGRQPALLDRLFVAQVERPPGEIRPYAHRVQPPCITRADEHQIALATKAWDAFRQPTPEAWSALLAQPIDALAGLRRTVRAMLAELPAAGTGLRASERRLLELSGEDGATPRRVMTRMIQSRDPGVFSYWEIGRLLSALGRGADPAITGISDGPFDVSLHQDAARHAAFAAGPIGVSDFGRALLHGEADISGRVPRHFWWGGTLLTNENRWRWDAEGEALIR